MKNTIRLETRPLDPGHCVCPRRSAASLALVFAIAAALSGCGGAALNAPPLRAPTRATALNTDTFLHGSGAVILKLHRYASHWIASPTEASCHQLSRQFTDLGTVKGIDTTVGSSPDPVLVNLSADEVSLVADLTRHCTSISADERSQLGAVDATLGRRIDQVEASGGKNT